MARVNIAMLAMQVGGAAARGNKVRQDPAVGKAAKEAWADIRQAGHSTGNLAREAADSWRRNGDDGTVFVGAR